jgi:hypothetical protein
MKPSEYKAEYENLTIHLGDGETTTVTINKYRLSEPKDGGVARQALRNKVVVGKGVTDFELRVGLGGNLKPVDAEFTKTADFHWYLRGPFKGKGAPEHCQIVLQLVHHFELATDLQKYADEQLGLDCNGFVGNFLLHAWGTGTPWTDHCLGPVNDQREGPDQRLDGFQDKRRNNRINDWDDIEFGLPHVFIRTNDAGSILLGNSGDLAGHIVISDLGISARQGSDERNRLRILESTASHSPPGLCEDWYSWFSEKKIGKTKIFNIDRGDKFAIHRKIWFMAFKVDAPKC